MSGNKKTIGSQVAGDLEKEYKESAVRRSVCLVDGTYDSELPEVVDGAYLKRLAEDMGVNTDPNAKSTFKPSPAVNGGLDF